MTIEDGWKLGFGFIWGAFVALATMFVIGVLFYGWPH